MSLPTTTQSPEPPLAGAWRAVALLWFVGGSAYLTRTMLTTMRVSVVHDIPMSDAQFGLLTSVFLWFYASVGPLGGFIGDRFSRRWVILVSLFCWSSVVVLTAYAKTFTEFVMLRAVLGLAQACYVPTGVALITDFHRGPTRAFATGLNLTGMICGSLLGSSCGWIADRHGWRFAYLVMGVGSLALVALNVFLLRDSPREGGVRRPARGIAANAPGLGEGDTIPHPRFFDAIRSLARPGPFYLFIASMALQGAVSWIIIAWMPTVMREQYHLGQGAAGLSALGFLYVFQTTGLLLGGVWSDRWTRSNPRARILLPAYAIMLAAPLFWLTGWSHGMAVTLVSLCAYGLAMGIMGANQMAIVCLVVDARYRATAMGVLNAGTAISGGLAIYGLGALRDAGVGVSLILVFAGMGVLLIGFLMWLINRYSLLRPASAPATP